MKPQNHASQASQETASLVKRLAGPSINKAGLAQDQTDINRIITDASKGSKFYENEKKKDKELTEKIMRILKQRDEALRGIDIQKIERAVDQQLAELESQRDLSQIIVHVDMDAFYANVELLDHPELDGKPFGVGGGVLTTASYEARKYGVRSGMAGFIAKKLCPDIILLKPRFSRYSEMSKKVMDVFRRYDPNMCPAGTDEGYLNITTYCEERGLSPDECVQEMRNKVKQETLLTVSAGIAPNKMLAKICSDRNKPNGQFHIPFDSHAIVSFMRDLSIRKIPGVGRVNERLLESIGIKTCRDIHTNRATIAVMDKQFGLTFLLRTYLGIASNVVQPSRREERKSIGYERTFTPISDKAAILRKLEECAEGLEADMKESGWTGKTVTLKFKLDTYQVFTRAKSFDRWITKKEQLFETGKELLQPEWPLKLRLIGLRLTKLKDLAAPAQYPGGIKRFFESINAPQKRFKLATEDENQPEDPDPEFDIESESMPNFHEHEEDDMQEHLDEADDAQEDEDDVRDEELVGAYESKHRPPVSAPARASLDTAQVNLERRSVRMHSVPPTSKVLSTKKSRTASAATATNVDAAPDENSAPSFRPIPSVAEAPILQTCPICSKSLIVDNQAFNAHIDFCLSRGAIREAQGEAAGCAPAKSIQKRLTWADKGQRRERTTSAKRKGHT